MQFRFKCCVKKEHKQLQTQLYLTKKHVILLFSYIAKKYNLHVSEIK